MDVLEDILIQTEEFHKIRDALNKGGKVQIAGGVPSANEHIVCGLGRDFDVRVIITEDEQKASRILNNYTAFDRNAFYYPAIDPMFYKADIRGNYIFEQRMEVVKALFDGQHITVITTPQAFSDRLSSFDKIDHEMIKIKRGDSIDLSKLSEQLVEMGYENESIVTTHGEFSIRGNIIDVFPFTEDAPYRIDLWGDDVESIKFFDTESQRSIAEVFEIKIFPGGGSILEDIFLPESMRREVSAQQANSDARKDVVARRVGNDARIGSAANQVKAGAGEMADISQGENVSGKGSTVCKAEKKEKGSGDSQEPPADKVKFIEYFSGKKALFVIDEPDRTLSEYKELADDLKDHTCLLQTMFDEKITTFDDVKKFSINVRNIASFNGRFTDLVEGLKKYKKDGYRVVLYAATTTRAENMVKNLAEYGVNAFVRTAAKTGSEGATDAVLSGDIGEPARTADAGGNAGTGTAECLINNVFANKAAKNHFSLKPGQILIRTGSLREGFEYPDIKFSVISEVDIFGKRKISKRRKRTYSGDPIKDFTDLNIGDYVVHEKHGIGVYRGIERMTSGGTEKDYMKIEYAKNDCLYVLATDFDKLQKYAGADAQRPKINRIGGKEWKNTKERVNAAVKDIAKELVQLYAIRQSQNGYQYGPDTIWQQEFEEQFEFEETADQLKAIEEVKADMESRKIMDRLICGDVGFGKTEVAVRAAFKAVQEGKQVAFLVPTTVLAQQHFNTITRRMENYPVTVKMLSRFSNGAEQKEILKELKTGMADIVIGTHRLLSKDVAFKNLGLLVVDEEQRFGVTHKEKIKELRKDVDVLTLSATPIPRTLYMSLSGIRDMSLLTEPPVDRVPIQTYVMEYSDDAVKEAINREAKRGGQVYYIYNRVGNIEFIAENIQKMVPNLNVQCAHGQMRPKELEQIMEDFIAGTIDVLVSTTIVETGLDISNVNTIIVHDADNFGLSQLYQLRGRVGRSSRTAYAFLMYRKDKLIREVAEKRLKAIREFSDLGSGIRIAMRDLEIRGAGNLLGAEQSGHMESVGYEMYCRMLNRAVMLLRGQELPEEFDTAIDLDIDGFIPSEYIKNEYEKLGMYKKIAAIEKSEDLEDVQDELLDRFGPVPKVVGNLLTVSLIRAKAHEVYVTEVSGNKKGFKLTMLKTAPVKVEKLPAFLKRNAGTVKFVGELRPYFIYSPSKAPTSIKGIQDCLLSFFALMKELV